jgi:hypothetical protein
MDSQRNLYVSDWALGRVQRFAPVTSTAPVATIVKLATTGLYAGDVLTVTGMGQVSQADRVINRYEWQSSEDGVLGDNSPTLVLNASELSTGTHILSLYVEDSSGEPSNRVYERFYVAPPPSEPTLCTGDTWTMLLYLVGDYADSGDLQESFDEAVHELIGVRNPCVGIAVQLDGHESIGTDASDTIRLFFPPNQPYREELIDEQPMDDPATLAAFVARGQEQLPAQHYYLAIADHGQAIRGIGWDVTTDFRENPPEIEYNTFLTSAEIAAALADPRLAPIDVLHLDACSMALLDVFYELRNSARYVIASQYLGWSIFAYDEYAMLLDPAISTDPASVAGAIVDKYAERAEGFKLPYTLSVFDMSQAEAVKRAVDALAVRLAAWVANDPDPAGERAQLIIDLRKSIQTFDSNGNLVNTAADMYIDLLDWATRIKDSPAIDNPEVATAATELIALLQGGSGAPPPIFSNRAISNILYLNQTFVDLAHANGVSIYFPLEKFAPPADVSSASIDSQALFNQVYADYLDEGLFNFTRATRWDELLAELLGVPAPGEQLATPPPPLAPVNTPPHIFLPIVIR